MSLVVTELSNHERTSPSYCSAVPSKQRMSVRGLGTSAVDELLASGISGEEGDAADGSREDIMMVIVEAQRAATRTGRGAVDVGFK